MGDFFGKFAEVLAGLSMVRKVIMGGILALTIGVVGYVVQVSRLSSMEPLFTNLNSEDMGTIITRLDKQGTSYEVDRDKRTVMVPATDVLDIRMKLAQEGLPRFGGVGFELFDRGGFGMSEFEQRVNYQRAMEGELTRTIGSIHEVENARVHLVLPEKSLFSDSQQAATASVIVKLGSGMSLSTSSVNAITHLVASAVEGLRPDEVTVIDTTGRLLTAGGGDPSMAAGGQAFDQKMQIEKAYERRIVELLTPIVGLGKVVARITAGVDFTRTENTDENIDPAKVAVLSEQRSSAKRSESAGGAGGAAGAAANAPGGAGGGAGGSGSGNSDESNEQITYAVSKSTTRKTTPIGALQKLSVAILVDGTYEDKEGKPTYAPRAADELTKIEELIKSAIGFDAARGDQVKVQNMQFMNLETQVEKAQTWYSQRSMFGFLAKIIVNVLVVIMMLLVVLLVIRPLLQSWRASRATVLAGGGQSLDGNVSADIGQLVQANPVAATQAIRQWLQN